MSPAKVLGVVERVGAGLAALALLVLALRAGTRLDAAWDSLAYHLPFAAHYGGLPIRYDLDPPMSLFLQGFPPFPHWVMGMLWAATGSIHAVGLANLAALSLYLLLVGKAFRAPPWLVALIALSTPLVVIHASSTYVDLFANSFLALGVVGLFRWILHPDDRRPEVVGWSLAGLAGAAWSKFQLAPLALLFLVLHGLAAAGGAVAPGTRRRTALGRVAAATLFAMLPYLKNLAVYGNPFWPIRLPVLGEAFPYRVDQGAQIRAKQRPPHLPDASQPVLFVHSILEIGHPTRYPYRERWNLDQGQAWIAYRMGGFWNVGVVAFLGALLAPLLGRRTRRGVGLAAAVVAVLALVSVLPASNELRYYMFLPLSWAGALGLLYQELRRDRPGLALLGLLGVLGVFGFMVSENRSYYRLAPTGWREIAADWKADRWWPLLSREVPIFTDRSYPESFLLTGPTGTEYPIRHREAGADPEAERPGQVWIRGARLEAPDAYWDAMLAAAPSALGHSHRALALLHARRYAEAAPHLEAALRLGADGSLGSGGAAGRAEGEPEGDRLYDVFLGLATVEAASGDAARAFERLAVCARLDPDGTARAIAPVLAPYFDIPGRAQAGLDFLTRLEPLYPGASWLAEDRRRLADLVARTTPEALLASSFTQLREGHPADALAALDAALAARPDYPEAWNNRAMACADLGRWDDAVAAARRAVALAPGMQLARNNLAWVEARLRESRATPGH